MKPNIYNFLFAILILFSSFNIQDIKAQEIKFYFASESINEFLDSHSLNFDQVQIVFLNEINGQYILSNAEAVGIPSNNSKNIVVFCSNPSLDLNNLKIIKNSNETIDFIEGMSINQNNLTSLSIKIFNQSFEINI